MATIQNEHPEFEKFENCTNQQFGLDDLFRATAPEGSPWGTLRGLARPPRGWLRPLRYWSGLSEDGSDLSEAGLDLSEARLLRGRLRPLRPWLKPIRG